MSIQIDVVKHILYQDDDIMVLYKPASLMVEPDRNGHPNLLQQVRKFIKASLPKGSEVYAQHIHRLDRPVSGIVLFAKRKEVLRNLSEQFAQRQVKKYYQALTTNAPSSIKGTLEHWHHKQKKKAIVSHDESPGSEKAILHYSTESFSTNKTLWTIELVTGKFHQIRAQLAAAGCPVIGDALYGSTEPYKENCIALHANKLVFKHPVSDKEMTITKENDF